MEGDSIGFHIDKVNLPHLLQLVDPLGQWIFNRSTPKQYVEEIPKSTETIKVKTVNAVQKNWKTPSEFPLCSHGDSDKPIVAYAANLKVGRIFSRNQYADSLILDFAKSEDKNTLWVMCRSSDLNAIKPYALAQITYENDLFIHSNLGSFFRIEGAEKYFALAQGLEWTGGDTFDDSVM